MKKRELRAILSSDLFIKIDKLRRLYGGISRSAIIGIAIKQMIDREMTQKKTAPMEKEAA
jgi:metal-responsive CopG/Arc/MetJ family transcriptional regulator